MTMGIITVVRQYLAAAFFIVTGLIAPGCGGESTTVSSTAELAFLTVDPGTIQPTFNGSTTQYNVDLSNDITSVTITALPAATESTVTINGQTATNSVITLGAAGTTTPVSIGVSESGMAPRTYMVSLVRAGLTGNNSLQSLTVSPGTLAPAFNANTQDYTVDVDNNVGSVTVTPTLSDPAATMSVNGNPAISGQASSVLLKDSGHSTAISIVVTAQNGNPKTYTITVGRGISTNKFLKSLTVLPGTLGPPFSPGIDSYTVNVGNTVAIVTVTAAPQNANASLQINGLQTDSRSITLRPTALSTPISLLVTAQNGSLKTYWVNVIRAP